MNISEGDLRERYNQLSDEELLNLWGNNTLIDLAKKILKEELHARGITPQEQENDEVDGEIEEQHVHEDLGEWVTVGQFTTGPEAHILRARLESEDIPAIVADEHLVTANWFLSNAVGGVRVRVPGRFAKQAYDIVKEIETGNSELPDESEISLSCPKCNSDDVIQFKRSWKISFLVFYFLHIPVPYYANEYKCNQCRKIWKESASKSS